MTDEIRELQIKDLHVSVEGKEIVKGVNLTVRPGEVHAIMGPNGSGKSTLAYTLMGHPGYQMTQGEILVDGVDISAMDPNTRAQQGLFLAFQYPHSIPGVTMANFLRTAVNAVHEQPMSPRDFRAELRERMKLLKMNDEFAGRYVNEGFSGGEKKRAEILQMAMLKPKYAVLDETDSGLDIDALHIVADGVNALLGPGMGVLVITHYQRLLNYINPDFVHVLVNGKIVQEGGPELALELEKLGYEQYEPAGAPVKEIGMALSQQEQLSQINEYKFGFRDPENYAFKSRRGLDPEIVEEISWMKSEPQWMREFRLRSLRSFEKRPLPTWGADLGGMDFQNIFYYIKPMEEQGRSWDEVPEDIKNTFDRLGIPEAERKFLAGVGAQYESEVVYHSLREDLEKKGVIFTDMDGALRDHPDIVKQYFGTVIPPNDNKLAALNSAVWSGGSFVYVPAGRASRYSATGVLPHQCGERRSVRADAHHRRAGQLRPLCGRLHRTDLQQ